MSLLRNDVIMHYGAVWLRQICSAVMYHAIIQYAKRFAQIFWMHADHTQTENFKKRFKNHVIDKWQT